MTLNDMIRQSPPTKRDLRYLKKMDCKDILWKGEHGKWGMAWLSCRACGGKYTVFLPSGNVGCKGCNLIWRPTIQDKYFGTGEGYTSYGQERVNSRFFDDKI